MGGEFAGKLPTDIYGTTLDEVKWGVLRLTPEQAPAPSPDAVHAAITASATLVTTVTSGVTNPPYPRNLVITPGGTVADIAACIITITGTNIMGEAITEAFSVDANATDMISGELVFKTVTSISIPAQDGAGATFEFGYGRIFGLPIIRSKAALCFFNLYGYQNGLAPFLYDEDGTEPSAVYVDIESWPSVRLDFYLAL